MANVEVVSEVGRHDHLVQMLSEGLADEYDVVVSPVCEGGMLDVIVVGLQGIFLLVDNCGQRSMPLRKARSRLSQQLRSLRTFAQSSFEHMDPAIYGAVVCRGKAEVAPSQTEYPTVSLDDIVSYIDDYPAPVDTELLDAESRDYVTGLLVERNRAVDERTSVPFVFQPQAGRHAVGKQVWTIKDAIRYMDGHPESGMEVIEDASFENWLIDEGATRLARQAAKARMTAAIDRRIPLEQFLIASGMVTRPRLVATPSPIDFGFVLPQSTYSRRVRISKTRGNGYLFGTLDVDSPWLSVEPERYYDGQVEADIKVDGSRLDRLPGNYSGNLLVESSSSHEVLQVPVKLRLLELPSTAERRLWRPLLHALVLGMWGALLCSAWYVWALPVFEKSLSYPWYAFVVLASVIWAVLGFIGGRVQPANWPVWYSMLRVWARSTLWGVGLGALAMMMYWSWEGFSAFELIQAGQTQSVMATVGLSGMLLGIFPTAVGEIEAHYREREYPPVEVVDTRRRFWRQMAGAMALVAVLLIGPRYVRPQWERLQETGAMKTVSVWLERRWTSVESTIRGYVDDWYVRRNDRRAGSNNE